MGWKAPPSGAARIVLSDPEFAVQSRVSAITVTSLTATGEVLQSERVQFSADPYFPTYDMLLAVRDRVNAQLAV